MHTKKLTISIRASSLKFVDEYLKLHGFKNRSEIIEKAVALLHEQELELDSGEAADESEPFLDILSADRIENKDE
ncbi:MAG: ribbon-helix-helix domain-containing protein [Burkholderiales bacterium]